MAAGDGFTRYAGDPVATGQIPQWAFPGAHPATLRARSYRERVLAFPVPVEPLARRNYYAIVAYCDEQIAAVERGPLPFLPHMT